LAPAFVAVVLLGMPAVIVSAGSYPGRGRRQPSATDGAGQMEFLKRTCRHRPPL
jgi:hypothetical protein